MCQMPERPRNEEKPSAHRSWNMSRIRSKNTRPELRVRSIMHRLGYRFRLHGQKLPGTPDLVLARQRTVVFVHGCFWHRHSGCRLAYNPKSRIDFWRAKFEANVRRDRSVRRQLRKVGWRVVTVWECELADPEKLARRLQRVIK
jgi:DNA mismatch endonuclease, patch repair protein